MSNVIGRVQYLNFNLNFVRLDALTYNSLFGYFNCKKNKNTFKKGYLQLILECMNSSSYDLEEEGVS